MDRQLAESVLAEIFEKLASIEHERWSHWQRYLHDKTHLQADGSLLIPAKLAQQWERLFSTPYAKLAEPEKESDREQVRRYLPTIAEALSTLNQSALDPAKSTCPESAER